MIRASLLISLALLSFPASGQEFRPYRQAHITEVQWKAYLEEIESKYGGTARIAPNQPLVIFNDANSTLYAFTRPGHAAHPAWIARKVVEKSGKVYIDQVGFFAGDEKSFAALFQAYKALDGQVREYVKDQAEPKPK